MHYIGTSQRNTFLGLCLLIVLGVSPVRADEQVHVLAERGEWGAISHTPSMTSAADVCLAVNLAHGVAFRADGNDVEFRVTDKTWSLPSQVAGSITIAVGGAWSRSYDIDDNTADTVTVILPNDDIVPLFAAMDKAPSMTVAVGKARPMTVSLVGSTVVTNAFRTCARIGGNADTPGGNPFK